MTKEKETVGVIQEVEQPKKELTPYEIFQTLSKEDREDFKIGV